MLGEPTRSRVAERRSSTIAEIVDAAWEVARTHGIGGLTLRDVARKVGMRPPSLYSYFDSKDALYDAMFAQGCREFLEAHASVRLTGETVADLKTVMRFFVGFCTENTVRYQLLFQRVVPGFEPSKESFALSEEGLRKVVTLLQSSGVTDARALDLLTAIGTGLADQQISNDPGGSRWIGLTDDAIEMFYAYVQQHMKGEPE
ncbi:TetR/AcrR family transcriptional regulator [Phytoactinopolyspora alkaliphila]|uniref:TetR/AcrR family transcriptional regulator n=1 Tax=Phytoactinopolyspora alkaliphila TaxID=1783498 RepID=A0A6N9YMW6_9ACTN|nr:TetR/AcrR family transcriptional regulator [Phytoactinopolyspora alkaliphila]NED96333.1 TetR/AcrR family transcriptional regulator [Phytoactinopolyspora alkaliphila]